MTEFLPELETYVGLMRSKKPEVEIVVVPGGRMPECKSDGAVGYDSYARAIVSEVEQDPDDNRLRKTIFDFKNMPESSKLQECVITDPDDEDSLAYVLRPGAHALVGVGFVTAMPEDMFYWLTPRSGLSMARRSLANAPGTVDSDYRGEAGALFVNEAKTDFILQRHMRIAQVVFQHALHPKLVVKETIDDLDRTNRGADGFGSTGLFD